jgi:hypothetical protein
VFTEPEPSALVGVDLNGQHPTLVADAELPARLEPAPGLLLTADRLAAALPTASTRLSGAVRLAAITQGERRGQDNDDEEEGREPNGGRRYLHVAGRAVQRLTP